MPNIEILRSRSRSLAVLALLLPMLATCSRMERPDEARRPSGAGPARVSDARLLAADREPGQWLSHGRTYSEQRFSPLDAINTSTVGRLGLAWHADFDSNRGQEATPLFIDGVLYVSTAWSKVHAYDARTGRNLWKYDPKVPGQVGTRACCDVVNRGVAAWNGKIYVGTLDGRLVALDAATGQPVWTVNTIDEDQRGRNYTITGAPRVFKGLVVIGNGGAEYGVRGFVTAYDAETGRRVWRFYTVPGDPAKGPDGEVSDAPLAKVMDTWNGEWWIAGGGGTVWDAIVYDPVTDLLFVGVGNGSPWDASVRSPGGGDNLFLSSIVAVNPLTGEYVWHFQTTPGETWDFTATQPMMVADLAIGGRKRHVLMQAPKNGFFYVLDAATGEFISGQMFIPLNWATGLDAKGRPLQVEAMRFDRTGKGAIVSPGGGGAHSWHPWSYNPNTGLVYIPAMLSNFAYQKQPNYRYTPGAANSAVDFAGANRLYAEPGAPKRLGEGFLLAWDPVTQKEAWRVSYGSGRGGGTLSTAGGLVFQGNSTDKAFAAFDAKDGRRLWSIPVQANIVAGAISYEARGEQYIAVVAGGPGGNDYYAPNGSRLLVFKLDAKASLPSPVAYAPRPIDPPMDPQPAELVAAGQAVYSRNCALCHGDSTLARGVFPDLRRSPLLQSQPAFDAIVLGGALQANGMASFSSVLKEEDTRALRAYVISQAQAARSEGPAAPGAPAEAPR